MLFLRIMHAQNELVGEVDQQMKILVLDDDKNRHEWFQKEAERLKLQLTQAWTAEEAIQKLAAEKFDVIFLDHDLQLSVPGKEWHQMSLEEALAVPDGRVVARHMAQMPKAAFPKLVHIHSWNPDGAKEMQAILKDAGFRVSKAEFGQFKLVA